MDVDLKPIGRVKSARNLLTDDFWCGSTSVIELDPASVRQPAWMDELKKGYFSASPDHEPGMSSSRPFKSPP